MMRHLNANRAVAFLHHPAAEFHFFGSVQFVVVAPQVFMRRAA
jgi:hypothetical protein